MICKNCTRTMTQSTLIPGKSGREMAVGFATYTYTCPKCGRIEDHYGLTVKIRYVGVDAYKR